MEFSMEQNFLFYELLADIASILEFDWVLKAFYCGTRLKWNTPNCLLVVIKNDETSRFLAEINHSLGATGTACLFSKIDHNFGPYSQQNKPYNYHYKVITDRVYEKFKNDWSKLADESWIHSNNPYVPGIELNLDVITRIHQMKAFL